MAIDISIIFVMLIMTIDMLFVMLILTIDMLILTINKYMLIMTLVSIVCFGELRASIES